MAVLFRELKALYAAFRAGARPAAGAARCSTPTSPRWQRAHLDAAWLDAQVA